MSVSMTPCDCWWRIGTELAIREPHLIECCAVIVSSAKQYVYHQPLNGRLNRTKAFGWVNNRHLHGHCIYKL